MAAVIAAPVAGAVGGTAEKVGAQLSKFADDPIGYFIVTSRKVGAGLLIVGAAMGVAGYYMQAAATSAANDAGATIQSIGGAFGNLKAPTATFSGNWGTAPVGFSLQGISNFFGDAAQDLANVSGDLASLGSAFGEGLEEIPTAIGDLGVLLLNGIINFPRLLWDGFQMGIVGGIAVVLNWAFPYFLIGGAALLIASLIASGLNRLLEVPRRAWKISVTNWSDRQVVKWQTHFDRLLGNRSFREPSAAPALAPVRQIGLGTISGLPEPSKIVPEPSGATDSVPESVPEPVLAPKPEISAESGIPPELPETLPVPLEPTPDADRVLGSPPTQGELEEILGDARTMDVDRRRAELAAVPRPDLNSLWSREQEAADLERTIEILEEGLEA